MHNRIEDDKVFITFDFSVSYDAGAGGYIVVEKDGPNHEVRWGPMPHYLVDAFIREHASQIATAFQNHAAIMFERHIWP